MAEKQKKSPQQRAQEALDVAERRVKKLTEKIKGLRNELDTYEQLRSEAITKRDYAAQNPDLPKQGELASDEKPVRERAGAEAPRDVDF